MSKSLKDMIKHARKQAAAEIFPDETKASVSELIDKYGGKSEEELMNALMNAISQQKQEGIFDAAQAEAAAKSIMPMLNAEQAEKLKGILEMLK